MMRTDARWLLAVVAALLALAAPAHAVYHLAGTFDLDASTKNFGFDDFAVAAFAVAQDGSVFALNKSAPWITKYAPTGQRLVQFGSADQISAPKGIATDAAGGVYVSDESKVDESGGVNGQVHVFSTAGSFQRTILYENPLYGPGSGFTVDGTGHVYITDTDTQIIDGAGKVTGVIDYGRVDASDMGAIAGVLSGSGAYGRANVRHGETVFTFDAAGNELGKLPSPSASDTTTTSWHPDRLASNTKGEMIILDTYCRAVVVHKGTTLTDAAYLNSLLTPGKKAGLRAVGSDAAGDIFVLIGWGDGSFHVARLVPGSGSGDLPRKGCRALPGGDTTTPPPTTAAGSPQYSLPPQALQNRTFLLGLSCPDACRATVTAKAIVGGKKYRAGRKSARVAAGGSKSIEVRIPQRTYQRIVRRLQAGKAAKLRVALKVVYANGRTFSTKVSLPLTPAR